MLVARFTGEDLNGDNIIASNELTSLYADGIDYLAPDSATTQRHITSFRYRNVNDYAIDVTFSRNYDPNDGQTGWAYGRDAYWSPTAQHWGWVTEGGPFANWTGTSETVANVVSSVPEPTTIAMLGLGLFVIGLTRGRSNAAARGGMQAQRRVLRAALP